MKTTRHLLVLCLLLSLGCWGCRAKVANNSQEETTATLEATATAEIEPDPSAVNAGLPIQDISDKAVAGDNSDRVALLAVGHTATGIPENFYVWQLYVQGSSAVGDLQGSTSGNRLLVAFENDGAGWKAVYQKKFIDASEAELLASCPLVTDELAQRVDFVVPVEIDDFYVRERGSVEFGGYDGGSMYAPTRLPEGFTLVGSTTMNREGSSSVEYARGEARLSYFAWISGDYGDQPTPKDIYTGLRFGDLSASMDSAFYYRTDDPKQGPFLTAQGHHAVCAVGITPGMVAAVAESMVRVDGTSASAPSAAPTEAEMARFTQEGAKIVWKGADNAGTWWVASNWTDALGDRYFTLWMRDTSGNWHQTVPVQGGIECSSFGYPVPVEVVSALKQVGVSVRNN